MQDRKDGLEKRIEGWLQTQPRWYSHALHLSIRGQASEVEMKMLAGKACIDAGMNIDVNPTTQPSADSNCHIKKISFVEL